MQRRKFLATVGSVAAGSAAAIGTGAVTSQESPRLVNADIVNDSNGTLSINTDSQYGLENDEYVEFVDGQLTLKFNGYANSGGGLNPDSTYHFDNVFNITNQTQDALAYAIDKTQLDNPDAFHFYAMYPGGGPIIGDRDSDFVGHENVPGHGVNIGITINTPDSVPEDWETGKVVIKVTDNDDANMN